MNSPPGLTAGFPDGAPLLDCFADARGNARMTWSWQWKKGYHERKDAASLKLRQAQSEAGIEATGIADAETVILIDQRIAAAAAT